MIHKLVDNKYKATIGSFMNITIKELADELGVSKTTISNTIDMLGIQQELKKIGNRFMLDEIQVSKIKTQIMQSSEMKTSQKLQNETQSETQKVQSETEKTLISFLETQISILHDQLTAKDAQINMLGKSLQDTSSALTAAQEALKDTTAALTAAQALHAGTIKQQLTEHSVISDVPSDFDSKSDTSTQNKRQKKYGNDFLEKIKTETNITGINIYKKH